MNNRRGINEGKDSLMEKIVFSLQIPTQPGKISTELLIASVLGASRMSADFRLSTWLNEWVEEEDREKGIAAGASVWTIESLAGRDKEKQTKKKKGEMISKHEHHLFFFSRFFFFLFSHLRQISLKNEKIFSCLIAQALAMSDSYHFQVQRPLRHPSPERRKGRFLHFKAISSNPLNFNDWTNSPSFINLFEQICVCFNEEKLKEKLRTFVSQVSSSAKNLLVLIFLLSSGWS